MLIERDISKDSLLMSLYFIKQGQGTDTTPFLQMHQMKFFFNTSLNTWKECMLVWFSLLLFKNITSPRGFFFATQIILITLHMTQSCCSICFFFNVLKQFCNLQPLILLNDFELSSVLCKLDCSQTHVCCQYYNKYYLVICTKGKHGSILKSISTYRCIK